MVYCNYVTARYFNRASPVAMQYMLSNWTHVQVSSVVQRKQHEHNVKKKHEKPQSGPPKYLYRVLI